MFKKCSKFHLSTLRGFDFTKTVYELFDNLSYIHEIIVSPQINKPSQIQWTVKKLQSRCVLARIKQFFQRGREKGVRNFK